MLNIQSNKKQNRKSRLSRFNREFLLVKKSLTAAFVCLAIAAVAQNTQQKINQLNYELYKANYKMQNTNKTVQDTKNNVNGAVNTVGNSTETIKDVTEDFKSLFGKKKGNNALAATPASTTSPATATKQATSAGNVSPVQLSPSPPPVLAGCSKTIITIKNCSYTLLKAITDNLAGNAGISNIQKSFENGTGILTIDHKGTSDALLDFLMNKMQNQLDVTGLQNGTISLASKTNG